VRCRGPAHRAGSFRPGDAYSDSWSDLAAYGPVETKRFLVDFFYVSSVTKPAQP